MHSGNSKIKYTVIVAAAGNGTRMGLAQKKQFLEIDGLPLYLYPVLEAQKTKEVDEIIIVTNSEAIKKVEVECKAHNVTKLMKVVAGGKERQDSIWSALQEVEDKNIVAVQDGARIFMKSEYLIRGYDELLQDKSLDGVCIGVPVVDTIKVVDTVSNKIISTPERKNLVAIQTPQIFRCEKLKFAYKDAFDNNFYGTDDSSLVERVGGNVKIILGSYDNIKITTQEDLKKIR